MPSTYTDELGLELQANGENNSTWGTQLNSLIDQLDDIMAAKLSKSVAGSDDVTLTAAEALHAYMLFTGTLTGNINVIVPSSEKFYPVYNGTSGSFTLTVKTTAGSGIEVPQGRRMALYCDTTNVVNAIDTFLDNSFKLADNSDSTKQVAFSVAGLTAATTRTMTIPDANITLAGLGAQTFTGTQKFTKGADVASASPLVILTDGNYFDVTGATGITSMTVAAGALFVLQFDSTPTLTHHSTNLDLPGGVSIVAAAGDVGIFYATAANQVQCLNWTQAGGLNYFDRRLQRVNLMDYAEVTVVYGNTGATPAFNLNAGNFQTCTVDQEVTSSTMINWAASDEYQVLKLAVTNGGAFAVAWPTSVDWEGGTAPTMTAAGLDFLVFWTYDGGTVVHGAVASLGSA